MGMVNLGDTIEVNQFSFGVIVDNLTSLGAVLVNFGDPFVAQQVSIACWVSRGVVGVHGVMEELFNNCFLQRYLLIDYVEGGTLAEVYFRYMFYVYWRNLVLGDSMVALYVDWPRIRVEGVVDGGCLLGFTELVFRVEDRAERFIESVKFYLDGVAYAQAEGPRLAVCVFYSDGQGAQLLVVAQVKDDGWVETKYWPKAWLSLDIVGGGGQGCDISDVGMGLDMGPAESGVDASADDVGVSFDGGQTGTDVDRAVVAVEFSCVCGIFVIGVVFGGVWWLWMVFSLRSRRWWVWCARF